MKTTALCMGEVYHATKDYTERREELYSKNVIAKENTRFSLIVAFFLVGWFGFHLIKGGFLK